MLADKKALAKEEEGKAPPKGDPKNNVMFTAIKKQVNSQLSNEAEKLISEMEYKRSELQM